FQHIGADGDQPPAGGTLGGHGIALLSIPDKGNGAIRVGRLAAGIVDLGHHHRLLDETLGRRRPLRLELVPAYIKKREHQDDGANQQVALPIHNQFVSNSVGGLGGTGSTPPGWKGWQRDNRLTVSQDPRRVPWTSMASQA